MPIYIYDEFINKVSDYYYDVFGGIASFYGCISGQAVFGNVLLWQRL